MRATARSAYDELLPKHGLAVTFATAVLVAGGILYGLAYLLDFQEIDTTAKLDAKTLFDLVKLSFGVVAGAGALVALVVAYRRQRVDEAGATARPPGCTPNASPRPASNSARTPRPSGSAASTPRPTTLPRKTCARPASTSCAPTTSSPSPPTQATPPPTRRSTTATSPCARSGTRSCASSATTTAAPREPAAPGRAATSTSPASSSKALWTSAARRSPAAGCPSTTRRVRLLKGFSPPSVLLFLPRSHCPRLG